MIETEIYRSGHLAALPGPPASQNPRAFSYAELNARQREIAAAIRDRGESGKLLLAEVSPVITVARRAPPEDLLLTPQDLRALGIELLPTDRGGLATWHGPGQWIAFPVDRLGRLVGDPRGVRKAVDAILAAVLDVVRVYTPGAEIRSGAELGVWGPRGKIAALGVRVDRGVLQHGVSLNVFRTPLSFQGLRPCGLDTPVDYLLDRADEAQFVACGEALRSALLRRLWPMRSD
jgi:lipoate-protein ligase B